MRILGISAYYHDSAAALLDDGRIVAAAQEERFTRLKHDPAFPLNAVKYCLEKGGGVPDAVVFYEKPLAKFERILTTACAAAPRGFTTFAAALPQWLKEKLWIPLQVERALASLGSPMPGRLKFSSHHLSHAASAFFPSPFKSAAVLTLDGVGEWETATIGHGSTNQLSLLREMNFPDSPGLLYSAFTYYTGFRVNSGEYKLMGLAPYGQPRYASLIREHLIDLKEDGSFRLNLDYFGYIEGQRMVNERFCALFGGAPRAPDSPLTQRECDLACSIQEVIEDVVLRMARTAHNLTGEKALCLAGGVALNCVANGRILREGPFEQLWIQPASGDAGGALGAALAYHHMGLDQPREVLALQLPDQMQGAFLGPEFDDSEIEAALQQAGLRSEKLDTPVLFARAAERLAAGQVVGFFQGRAEYGPRALGSRSILADARSPEMQRILNLKIKFRESFRPFAPIVLAEKAEEYFDLKGPSPYMLLTAPVNAKRRLAQVSDGGDLLEQLNKPRSDIPAVTHMDYSARVQTVSPKEHPRLHRLLLEFERHTGCPVLINTSFNVRGEPPVCRPSEAIEGFLGTEMDVLCIGSFLVEKNAQDLSRLRAVKLRQFSPD